MEMDGKWGAQQQKQHNVNSRRSLKKGRKIYTNEKEEEKNLKKRTTLEPRRSFPPAFLSFFFLSAFLFRFFHPLCFDSPSLSFFVLLFPVVVLPATL
jgi:hypothetical protein